MEITNTPLPDGGELHTVSTRCGDRFRLLVEPTGERRILIDHPDDPDATIVALTVDRDEATIIADILRERTIPNEIAELEVRIDRLSRQGLGGPPTQKP